MNETIKLNALLNEWEKNKDTVFIFWFEETMRRAEEFLSGSSAGPFQLMMTKEVSKSHISGKPFLFAEHYPLAEKENELYLRLDVKDVRVWSALDEPLFNRFGGEKIMQLMKQLGMKDDEPVENKMISNAIRNAQQKIASKIKFEQSARSQRDWLTKNLSF